MKEPFEFFKPEDFHGYMAPLSKAIELFKNGETVYDSVAEIANRLLNERGRKVFDIGSTKWGYNLNYNELDASDNEALLICQRPIEREPEVKCGGPNHQVLKECFNYDYCFRCGKDLR